MQQNVGQSKSDEEPEANMEHQSQKDIPVTQEEGKTHAVAVDEDTKHAAYNLHKKVISYSAVARRLHNMETKTGQDMEDETEPGHGLRQPQHHSQHGEQRAVST